jgi:hypothetical protein
VKLVLKSRQRRDWAATPVPGWFAGLEIREREDRRRAAECSQREAGKRTNEVLWDALYWARRVGFTPDQEYYAANAAVTLRGLRGVGNVTRQDVFERCRAQYPDLFPECLECAA